MIKMVSLTLLILMIMVRLGHPYGAWRGYIPNGYAVPDPCCYAVIWNGVGHQMGSGGGDRNPFGHDFDTEGRSWTRDLCLMDSDGDGKTNGQELGDPQCTWSIGKTPKLSHGLSNPGVCEPLDSPTCQAKNTWDVCAMRTVCDTTTTTSTTTSTTSPTTTSTTTTTTSPTTSTTTTTTATSLSTSPGTNSTTSFPIEFPFSGAVSPGKYHSTIFVILFVSNIARFVFL